MKNKWLILYIINMILIVGYWLAWKIWAVESRGFEGIIVSLIIINTIYGCIKSFKKK